MAEFIVRRGPEPGRIYTFEQDTVRIGSGARNDIVLIDHDVSREHCHLVRRDNVYELHDLDSETGTFVNGLRVNQEGIVLANACIVELGDSITLEYKPDSPHSLPVYSYSDIDDTTQAFLVVKIGTQAKPAVYPLEGTYINVGRSTENNIIIVEPEMSRRHLNLTLTQLGYMVEDIGSTNGTLVNQQPLDEPHLLREGDVIDIGETITMRFTSSPDAFIKQQHEIITDVLKRETRETTQRSRQTQDMLPMITDGPVGTSVIGTGVETESLMDRVLILYAREEWESIVAPLIDRLYEEKIPFWVDQYLTQGSDDWRNALNQSQLECWLLIVVVSNTSVSLDYVQRIWRHFINREKPIILLIYDDVDRLPVGSKNLHKVQYNFALPEAGLRQITQLVQRLQNQA